MTGEEFKLLKEGYQNSSQNLKDYLAEKGIPIAHYYYWKKKIENKPLESHSQFVNITSKISPNLSSSELEVIFPNGVRINFRNYPGSKTLLDLIQN